MNVHWKCPYCDHLNMMYVDPHDKQAAPFISGSRLMIASCDPDEGGCDAPCVIELQVQLTAVPKEIAGVRDELKRRAELDALADEAIGKPAGWRA